jgi:hypothetical protein
MARHRSNDPPPPIPLPGSGNPGIPDGMHQYVVNLIPPDQSDGSAGARSGVVDAYTRVAAAFVERARKELVKRGLADQVDGFGEAYGLPIVTLTATPAVAEVLRQIPGVEAVYRDDADESHFKR